MRSLLTITTAATDLALLTEAELRQATKVESGRTADLTALGRRVASVLTSRCNVRAVGAATPTLRLETISETFRLDCPQEQLILARRPAVEVVSVVEDSVTLTADVDFETDASAGTLRRLCSDYPAWWSASKIVAVYRAGWETVPDNLRQAALKMAGLLWFEDGRDANLRSIDIPGVESREYWVGPKDDPLIPSEIEDLLGDYINPAMA